MQVLTPSTTIRVLPAEEYHKLADLPDGFIPDPNNSIVIVAENEQGVIIGRTTLVVMPHIEGSWIDESSRGGTLALRMERALCKEAVALNIPKIFAYTTNATHTDYMKRLGWHETGFTVLEKEI